MNDSNRRVAAQRCRVLGVPVKLRELLVSVDDPDAPASHLRGVLV
jgi:hypothetical protein